MMLAHAEEFYISDNNHFAAILLKDGVVHNTLDICIISLGKEVPRFGHTFRSF